MASELQHLRLRITGRVQGVSFRMHAKRTADALGITGYAHNEPDGSVTVEAEGASGAIAAFVAWCERGPRAAEVTKVNVETKPLEHFKQFSIEL